MKPLLVLLSDLWGAESSAWWQHYTDLLSPYHKLLWLDSCALGSINTAPYAQEHLHQQFVAGGITKAVDTLLDQSTQWPSSPTILAFSVGGTIAWQAVERGLTIDRFYAVSATRLRYEETPLRTRGCLWYGSNDQFRPDAEWLGQQQLSTEVLTGYGHECYQNEVIVQYIVKRITATTLGHHHSSK